MYTEPGDLKEMFFEKFKMLECVDSLLLSACVHAQLCLTLCDLMECSPSKVPLSMGILQAWILQWLLPPSPGHLPYPGIAPTSPALAGRFFTTEPPVFIIHLFSCIYMLFLPLKEMKKKTFLWVPPLVSAVASAEAGPGELAAGMECISNTGVHQTYDKCKFLDLASWDSDSLGLECGLGICIFGRHCRYSYANDTWTVLGKQCRISLWGHPHTFKSPDLTPHLLDGILSLFVRAQSLSHVQLFCDPHGL